MGMVIKIFLFSTHNVDLIFFLSYERFEFVVLEQCFLQQVCTFMRQEKLGRCLKVEGN